MKPKTLSLENTTFNFSNNSNNIEVKVNLGEPRKLYKYYSLTDYSLKGLKNSTLYFSHSNLLNDVMDGNFMLWDMTKFIEQYKKDKNIKYDLDDEIKKDILKQITKPFLECRGVLSLSDTYKNELLWAHYTNETGFCIELDTKKLKNNLYENELDNDYLFFPLSYGKLKQIDFSEYIIYDVEQKNNKFNSITVNAMLPILYCFAQKDYTWKYENEWRILLRHKKFNSVSFPIDIINSEQKNIENYRKSGGNIEIKREIIEKVILSPLFFNNSRFNKVENINSELLIYNVNDTKSGKIVKEFLEILREYFTNKIYQIDKVIEEKFVEREIIYRIEIIDIGHNYIKLEKIKI